MNTDNKLELHIMVEYTSGKHVKRTLVKGILVNGVLVKGKISKEILVK